MRVALADERPIVLALVLGVSIWCSYILIGGCSMARAQQMAPVDTVLVVSVDVSNSVDDRRYKLQMEGIAEALEDPGVMNEILNGPRGGILFSLVVWSDRPQVALPWIRVANKAQAKALAARVRALPRYGGQFTCMGRMMRFLNDKVLAQIPASTFRTVVDISGDGKGNCNPEESIPSVRDELVGYGTTINGLPILEGDEAETLEAWYRKNVRGGPAGFILPAHGFEDFGRALRQKFIVEISMVPLDKLERKGSGPRSQVKRITQLRRGASPVR